MENAQKIKCFSKIVIYVVVFGALIIPFIQIPHAHAATMFNIEPLYKVLTPNVSAYPDSYGFAPKSYGYFVAYIWQIMMNAVNSLVLLVLVYVAFMNILRLKMDSYAVKKILPTFIMAVIMANFSFLICRIIIDLGNVAVSLFLLGDTNNKITSAFDSLIKAPPISPDAFAADTTNAGATYAGYIFAYSMKQLLLMVGSVLMFVLSFLFLIRNIMIYFLVAISPVAFMTMIIPNTSKYFQQWWSNMTKWVFMPVVSVFWLWLAGQFMQAVGSPGTEGGAWLLPLVFAGFAFYMAITSPMKLDKAIVGAWGGLGKKAWGATGGKAVEQGKWMAGGGFASMMTHRNQMAEERARKAGLTGKADMHKAKADRWTKLNPRAQTEAIKARFAVTRSTYDSAPKKTGYYNRLAGPLASAQAGYDANEDYKYKSPEEVGAALRKGIMDVNDGLWAKMPGAYKQNLMRNNGNNTLAAQKALVKDLAGMGMAKLITNFPGVGAFALGENKRLAQQYTSLGRGSKFLNAEAAFQNTPPPPPSSAVPNPGASPSSAVPGAPAVPGGGTTATPQQVLDQQEAELISVMREMVQTFKGMEEQSGGEGSLGGSEGFDQILAKISEIKPEMTLDKAGLAAMILPDRIKVEVAKYGPETLEQLRMQAVRAASITARVEANLQDHNLGVLRNIYTALKSEQDIGVTETKVGDGKKALEG
jgi:hypothetical protein